MAKHLEKALDDLKRKILSLSTLVEENLKRSVDSLENRDAVLATQCIGMDVQVDQREVDVEEECLKMLALYQPVATDMRFIVAILKLNNDLERIGDLAVNIAERAVVLASLPPVKFDFDFHAMFAKAHGMFKSSLDALVNLDVKLAWEVSATDDEVDAMNREVYEKVKDAILKDPSTIDVMIHLLSISRQLERVGDHATNIAEDVIYMVEGQIVRHVPRSY